MDFHTRDNYRHQVEKIAKKCNLSEQAVARVALELAKRSAIENPKDEKRSHVGYYLIGKGLIETERLSQIREGFGQKCARVARTTKAALYSISALVLTCGVALALWTQVPETDQTWIKILAGILILLSSSHLALALVNWLSTLLVTPKPLPRLDYSLGVPNESRTLVVVPTLLADREQVQKLLNDLEVRYLGNNGPNILFALLTDFRDALAEKTPTDDGLLGIARKGVQTLNLKYTNNKTGVPASPSRSTLEQSEAGQEGP